MNTNESLNNKHDIRIKWVRKFGVCCTSYTSFGKFDTPKTNGRASKLDFPPLPVFLKLSHTPELTWEILIIDNLSVRKQKLIFNANSQANPTNLD